MPNQLSVCLGIVTPWDSLEAFAAQVGDTWLTDHVRSTCRIAAPSSDIEVLGAVVGSASARDAQFADHVLALGALHESLGSLSDASLELVLGRLCADVARVSYLMRLGGASLSEQVVGLHDTQQRRYLGNVLGGSSDSNAAAS